MILAIAVRPPTLTLLTQRLLLAKRGRLRLHQTPSPRTRALSTSNPNMAKMPTEIASMKLNDGTSIPMVSQPLGMARSGSS